MPVTLYPMKFRPILKQVLWGGSKICSYKNLDVQESKVGESWEISDVKGSVSVVAEGALAGMNIDDLLEKYQELFVGEKNYQRFGNEFPLLVKFIDAEQDLSVQVHPNDEMARKKHQSNGKTEWWYILDSKPDAYLYAGFNRNIDKQIFSKSLNDNTVCELLNKEIVQPGDVFFLPAGRIHSICSGIFLAEVQQTSNVTYRVWDYNRKDANGNLRELHTDLALDSLDYHHYKQYKTSYKTRLNKQVKLQECSYFTVNLIEADTVMSFDYKGLDSFIIWMCVEGSAVYASSKKHKGHITKGETILFPACDQPVAVIPEIDRVKFLEIYVE